MAIPMTETTNSQGSILFLFDDAIDPINDKTIILSQYKTMIGCE